MITRFFARWQVLAILLIGIITTAFAPFSGHSTAAINDCSNVGLNQACAMYHGFRSDVVFSPVANEIALVSNFTRATIMKVPTGEILKEYEGVGGFGTALGYSPDGNTLAIATEDGISIWNLADNSKSYIATDSEVYSIDYSPDGKMMGVGFF